MDGWTVLQNLKSDERLRHIPVVVVTVVDEREVGLALGAVDYFVKPVERGALLSWLERHGVVPDPSRRPAGAGGRRRPGRRWPAPSSGCASAGSTRCRRSRWPRRCGLARARRFDLLMCRRRAAGPDGGPLLDALRAEPAHRRASRRWC